MSERLGFYKSSPGGTKIMIEMEKYLHECGLEESLIHLVKMRASQINGCAYCLDMHSRDARKLGETERRLYVLDAWRETELFTVRERAALAWTEALTLISQTHAPDSAYAEARAQFSDAELADLTLLIGTINIWNRIAIGFRMPLPVEQSGAV
ncbi:MAG TPA: carboxymuconolactone decarboxylase family protein [Rhizomicrobium sp.]|nr:carboxymuconolactone decarboxylase family protein [Rhizomicrobium sp.]